MNGAITVSVLTLATRAHDVMHALRDVVHQMYAGDEITLLKLLTSTFAGVCFLTSVSMTVCIQ